MDCRRFGLLSLIVAAVVAFAVLVDQNEITNKTSQIRRLTSTISEPTTSNSGTIEFQHRRRLQVIDNTEQRQQSQPLTAVIHVGPEKTGTSSIQHTIRLLQKNGLSADNYMLGNVHFTNYEPRKFTDCFVGEGQRFIENKNDCDMSVVQNVETISKAYNSNLIMSTEYLFLPNLDLNKLHNYLTSSWSDVRIVMYYRRYFEWFISLHTQGSRVRPVHKRWSIVEHLRNEIETEQDIEEKYVIGVMKRYQKEFKNVHIQNVHSSSNDVRELFFCGGAIPNGNNTCQAYREQVAIEKQMVKPLKRNTRNSLIYQEIAYHAKLLNLIDYRDSKISSGASSSSNNYDNNDDNMMMQPKYSFDEIASKIQHYHEIVLGNTEFDFHPATITCPTEDEYEWLYKKSIEFELLLFPQYHAEIGLQEIQNLFANSKQNLCSVDAKAVLHHEGVKWTDFFRTLV